MGKIALVFSGQGAQYAGMGRSFYENVPEVKAIFDAAEALRPGTLEQCFRGGADVLKRTENTQPCLYLAGIAGAASLKLMGIDISGAAGFSLGELPALAFGGAYSPLEGFKIACRRGALMQAAAQEHPASMAAALRLPHARTEALCARVRDVFPVNYNGPQQLVVAGTREGLEALKTEIAAAGGKLLPLAVGGGFHSPFMDGAAARFGEFLQGAQIKAPEMTVYSNYTSKPYGAEVRAALQNQINHPVRWDAIVADMTENGFDTFIEVGAGDTLAKLIGRIAPEARAFSADTFEKARQVKEIIHA